MLVGGRVAVHIHAAQSKGGRLASMATWVGRSDSRAERSGACLVGEGFLKATEQIEYLKDKKKPTACRVSLDGRTRTGRRRV